MTALLPQQSVPNLEINTVSGKHWILNEQSPEDFTMIVFYRGLHCPVCKEYLQDLNKKIKYFSQQGTKVIAISCDSFNRAQEAKQEWELDKLTLGYDFSIDQAKKWGLYISKSIKDEEPEEFCEPGLFLIKPDQTLYAAAIQSMPFARPQFEDVLSAIQFVIKNEYPARGETD